VYYYVVAVAARLVICSAVAVCAEPSVIRDVAAMSSEQFARRLGSKFVAGARCSHLKAERVVRNSGRESGIGCERA
jgi:hypothetical protein